MREENSAPGLLDEWIARTRLPWPHAIVAVGGTFALLLAVCAALDGVLVELVTTDMWRNSLVGPAIVVYILTASYMLARLNDEAIGAFRELVLTDSASFDKLVFEASTLDRRKEWLSLLIGAALGLLVFQPWRSPADYFWMKLYWILGVSLSFGLLGYVVRAAVAEGDQVGRLHDQPLAIDLFNPTPLEPIARHSLGLSLAFIGGATLSLLFLGPGSLLSPGGIVIYGVTILVSVLVFFLTMMRTHRVMLEVKNQELETVRRHLAAAYNELKTRAEAERWEDMEALSDAITAWVTYEKRIEEAPEWPYTTDTLGKLVVSALLPAVAWLGQIMAELFAR